MATPHPDSKWIRPLLKSESFMELAHQNGFMLTSYCLTLNAVQPLQENDVREALIHLARKVPTLRVCLKQKQNELWFYEMDPVKVDLQILEYPNLEEEYAGMTKQHYNVTEGPLWCARLFHSPGTEPCPMKEIKADFPHQYQLIFGFHHVMTDGFSTMKICGFFLDLLNDVIAGRAIHDEEQLAYHESGERSEKLVTEAVMHLMQNPSDLEKFEKRSKGYGIEALFLNAYPSNPEVTSRTLNLNYDFGKDDTEKLLKMCKVKGVSFHSAFSTAANIAIIEMLNSKGIQRDLYEITTKHVTNNRRYWASDTTKAFGPHIGFFTMLSKYDKNRLEEFWDYSHKFHLAMQQMLMEKAPYKEVCAQFLFMPQENFDIDELIKNMSSYYTTTNMGDITSSISGVGDKVQITGLKRTTSAAKQTFAHVLQTFRGRLLYGLDYDPSLVTKECAQVYANTVFQVLRKIMSGSAI